MLVILGAQHICDYAVQVLSDQRVGGGVWRGAKSVHFAILGHPLITKSHWVKLKLDFTQYLTPVCFNFQFHPILMLITAINCEWIVNSISQPEYWFYYMTELPPLSQNCNHSTPLLWLQLGFLFNVKWKQTGCHFLAFCELK